jgi:hypothetical protein
MQLRYILAPIFRPTNRFLTFKPAPKSCIPGWETMDGGNDEPQRTVFNTGTRLGAESLIRQYVVLSALLQVRNCLRVGGKLKFTHLNGLKP